MVEQVGNLKFSGTNYALQQQDAPAKKQADPATIQLFKNLIQSQSAQKLSDEDLNKVVAQMEQEQQATAANNSEQAESSTPKVYNSPTPAAANKSTWNPPPSILSGGKILTTPAVTSQAIASPAASEDTSQTNTANTGGVSVDGKKQSEETSTAKVSEDTPQVNNASLDNKIVSNGSGSIDGSIL